MKKRSLLAGFAAALSFTSAALAGATTTTTAASTCACDPSQCDNGFRDYWEGKYATGAWGGLRDRLEAKGIDPFVFYTGIPAGNVSGGRDEGNATYVDDIYFGVNLFLDKLVGWKGAKFVLSGISRNGHSLTDRYVGSVYNSQQVYGGQAVFLYNVTLEQRLFDDKFSIKLGRLSASDDFNNSPIYGLYVNNGINGNIRNVLFDTQFSAYPFATWAVRLRVDPTKETYAMLGAFQTTDDVFDRDRNGVDWSIHNDDGVFLIAQIGWTPELFKRPIPGTGVSTAGKDGKTTVSEPKMGGLYGHYHIGASISPWNHFAQFGRSDPAGNSYGFYAHADQMVYQEEPGSVQGLTLWTAVGYYPQDNISIVPFQVNEGLIYQGLFPTRDNDKIILGTIYGRFSSDYGHVVETATGRDPTYEFVFEAAYRFQLSKFAYIQPDLQFIHNLRGTGEIPDAVVLGTQFGVVF
jgi:porin